MAPKKDKNEIPPEIALLGRAKNSLTMGIVGLPNIGKSLTFSILTQVQVPSENYPFCTINPNHARVAVPDKRFEWLCDLYKPRSKVPTYLDVVDIAGLIKGASEGQGLGNAFLSNIKACDGIFHIIRIFEDQEIVHVEGDVDPIRDVEVIEQELRAKDMQIMADRLADCTNKLNKGLQKNDRHEAEELMPILTKINDFLKEGKYLYVQEWSDKEIKVLNELQLLTCKPVVYLINMSEKDYCTRRSTQFNRIAKYLTEKHPESTFIPYSAVLENRLLQMNKEEKKAYLASLGTGVKSALDKIVKTGYKELNLIHFFTAGPDEVRCWTIRKYTKAPDAAGVIHTDFHDFFICAEVFKYDDLKEYGSAAEVRAPGKVRTEGKEYIVQDGDIMYFKHNAHGGANKKK